MWPDPAAGGYIPAGRRRKVGAAVRDALLKMEPLFMHVLAQCDEASSYEVKNMPMCSVCAAIQESFGAPLQRQQENKHTMHGEEITMPFAL